MMNDQISHEIKVQAECGSCNGTGLYVGMGERSGAAVVCVTCEGTGERTIKVSYKDFTGRKKRENVRRVYRGNPGICIGENKEQNLLLEDFGGISYEDWSAGKTFPPGSEDRVHTCPAWFYQSVDYDLKPDWEDCWKSFGGSFSNCGNFPEKEKCWERWDREFGGKGEET